MKNIFMRFLSTAIIAIAVLGFVGCTEITGPEGTGTFNAEFSESGPGFVTLNITATQEFEAAYILSTSKRTISNPSIIFASGEKIKVVPNEPLRISGDIQENTEYFLYITAKLNAEAFSDIIEIRFKTGEFEFSNLLTVVDVDYDGYKMNISVPSSVKEGNGKKDKEGTTAIRYSQCDIMMYNLRTKMNGVDDYFNLLYNAGDYTTEDKVLEYSHATNVMNPDLDINGDGVINEEDLTVKWNPISPGEPVVFIAGEYQWMEEPDDLPENVNYSVNGFYYPAGWDPGYYLPMIDSTMYWQKGNSTKSMNIIDADVKKDIDHMWTGAFQRKIFKVKQPEAMDAKVNITVEDIGPVNATVILEPEDGVKMYAYAIMDDAALNQMIDLCDGKEEYLQWAITSYFAAYTFGTSQAATYAEIMLDNFFIDVPANSNIHILTTAMGDEMATTQNFNRLTFQTKEKVKDAPEVVVTALPDETSPFLAAFNIKCTTAKDPTRGPLKKAFYGANYKKDYILEVNGGSSYLTLGQSQKFSETEIQKINSDEGYTIKIPSIDGETTRLVVVGYNDENTPNNLNYRDILECPAVADCTTPYRDYKPYVKSDLYETLAGEWTAKAKLHTGKYHTSKIVLSDGIKAGRDFPTALPDSVYNIYKEVAGYSKEETNGYFDEFKYNAQVYNQNRVEYQNNILMNGWIDKDEYDRLTYRSPWDLFISREYSGVDVKSMFSDFGPKVYIEVSEGDKLSITGDMYYTPPAAYYSIPYYLSGYCPERTSSEGNLIFYDTYTTDSYVPLNFPVELSEDGNTLTIKAITDKKGEVWYPNLVGVDPTFGYMMDELIISDIVLTRGWSGETKTTAETKSCSAPMLSPAHNIDEFGYKSMTRFEKSKESVKIKGKVITGAMVEERLKALSEKLHNEAN